MMDILPTFTTRTWSIILLVCSGLLLNSCLMYLAYKIGQGKGVYYTLPSYTRVAKFGKGLVFHGKAGYEKAITANWLHDEQEELKVKDGKSKSNKLKVENKKRK